MKILYLASAFGPQGGGLGRVNSVLVEFLSKQKSLSHLTVFSLSNGMVKKDPEPINSKIQYRGFAGNKIGFASAALCEAAHNYDLVLFDHIQLAQIASFAPFRLGRQTVLFLLGIEVWQKLKGLKARALKKIDTFLAISHHTASRAKALNPQIQQVKVCLLGVPEDSSRAKSLPDISMPSGPFILSVGRMNSYERYKGHEQLIRALPLVKEKLPEAQLVFVGAGDDIPRLKTIAGECKVNGQVKFPGFISEAALHAYYEACSIFAMPSQREGFGLVYLEAMAHSKPCIAALGSAASEIIRNGETGLLVAPEDTADLAKAMLLLLKNEPLRNGMGKAARKLYLQKFTAEAFGRRFWASVVEDL
jgi:glycosyltransferase involved in cell wall biosynthesis